jgi:hypothetical protein
MRDTESAFFLAHHNGGGIDGLPLRLCFGECPSFLDTVSHNQSMHIAHTGHLANDPAEKQVGLY